MEMITTALQDLRLTLRRLAKTPRFTGLAVLMLGLALGAHLAIVSVIDTVLLKPLPVHQPERLLTLHETRDGEGFNPLAYTDYLNYQAESKTFEDLAVHYSTAPLHIDLGDATEVVNGSIASANYFPLLGVKPGRGRFFLPEEDATRGGHPVVVISHDLWQNRFGGRENIVGSVVKVNNTAFTVIGVAPPGFVGLDPSMSCELWMPTGMTRVGYRSCDALGERNCRIFEMVGRLAKGQTPEMARVEMDGLSRNLNATSENATSEDLVRGLNLTPLAGLRSENGLAGRRMVGLLMMVVTLVVVVASANLSGLLISRGLVRRQEIAVRMTLGAPRRRVVSLFVAEALILAFAGTVVGLLVAGWAGPLAGMVFNARSSIEVRLSPTVLGYAALLCGLTGLVAGWIPGLQASRPGLVSALKEVTGQSRRPKLLAAFVIVQIAVSFVLVYSTGLLTQSLLRITQAASAEPASIATLRLRPRLVSYKPEQGQAMVDEVVRRIEALPDVRSVGFGQLLPLWPGYNTAVSLSGETEAGESAESSTAGVQPVGPRTLETLGIPLLRGRDFDRRDIAGSPPVILINKTLAESLWPNREAVGERLAFRDQTYEVIGVVQDSAYLKLTQGPSPQIFTAFWQDPGLTDARLVVRTHGDASALLEALREIVHTVDPAVPLTEVASLDQRLRRRDLSTAHVASQLTGMACILAVLLSAVGLSGVLALAVAQRVREIGIRRALGAGHAQVMALVVRDAMILVSLALGCGLLASLAMEPVLGHFLYGVSPRDPGVLGGTLLLLAAVAGIASWWPARRAAGVDPIVALRTT